VHFERSLAYDGPWLQLMPDSAHDCERLEALAGERIRTCGPDTPLVVWRLRALLKEWGTLTPEPR
jgi:hypothetical protein